MPDPTGYILYLPSNRYTTLESYGYKNFAEPVVDFVHSRHIPLVCFIANDSGIVTHLGLGRKGVSAGTGLRRLNINDILELNTKITLDEIVNSSANRYRHHLKKQIRTGGLISPKSFEEFLRIFIKKIPEAKPILSKYSKERHIRIEKLPGSIKRALAEQKEAVVTALNIAGMDKHQILGWDYNDKEVPTSFLDGIENITHREDSIIINDLHNLPGFDLVKTTKYSSSVFKNFTSHLTILLANRMPLEELLGTDLIYFNEDFNCFIMVQYKVMEKENNTYVFRLPNRQLDEEIARMESIGSMLNKYKNSGSIDDFRFNSEPFFIKFCPRLDFDPDNAGFSKGIYIPLKYLQILQNDYSIIGKRGGKSISYENIGRYLTNTDFKTIIEGAWIGTNESQSNVLEQVIKSTLEKGKAVVYAIKRALTEKEKWEQYKEEYDETDQDDISDD